MAYILNISCSLFLRQVITPFRKLMLCAESRKEMEDWITALKSVQKWETYEVSLTLRSVYPLYCILYSASANAFKKAGWVICNYTLVLMIVQTTFQLSGSGLKLGPVEVQQHCTNTIIAENNAVAAVGRTVGDSHSGTLSHYYTLFVFFFFFHEARLHETDQNSYFLVLVWSPAPHSLVSIMSCSRLVQS